MIATAAASTTNRKLFEKIKIDLEGTDRQRFKDRINDDSNWDIFKVICQMNFIKFGLQ